MKKNIITSKVEGFLKDHYLFRYNEVTNDLEFKGINDNSNFKSMDDYEFNSIHRFLINNGIKCSINELRTILVSDFSPIFNPFKDYLNSFEPWDTKIDFIDELAKSVATTNDVFWKKCFKKWVVALVASLLKDEIINHTVIVLSGEQGKGKTTWTMGLVPMALKKYCFSGTINPDNKDTLTHLSECMLINLDELENLNKSEIGSIKEVITKGNIRIRKPYARHNQTLIRRASFAGSVNGKEFLTDVTGTRRFLCFDIININNNHSVLLENVYAQAIFLFNNNFQYWFDLEEIKEINLSNEEFRAASVEEELLLEYFEVCDRDDASHYLSTTQILSYINERVRININDSSRNKMGRVLRAKNFLKTKKGGRSVYALKQRVNKLDEPIQEVVTENSNLLRKAG